MTSVNSTPFSRQVSTSDIFTRREALVTSGCSTPTPAQNSFRPPPDPVDSMIGVAKSVVLPNSSATAVAKGNTVDEPTMRICVRSCAATAVADTAASASAEADSFTKLMDYSQVLLRTAAARSRDAA